MATYWMHFVLDGGTGFPNPYLALATMLVVGFACWSCFWDDEIRGNRWAFTRRALRAVAILQALRLTGEPLTWIAPLVLGAYSLAASYLISRRVEMRERCFEFTFTSTQRCRYGPPGNVFSAAGSNLIVASCVLAGSDRRTRLLAQFRCAYQTLRVAASQSILAQALAVALLTRRHR